MHKFMCVHIHGFFHWAWDIFMSAICSVKNSNKITLLLKTQLNKNCAGGCKTVEP